MISWNIQMRPEAFFPKENKIYRLESINNYLQIYDIVLLQESFEENSFKFIIEPKNQQIIFSEQSTTDLASTTM
jgi:hypothetical protein